MGSEWRTFSNEKAGADPSRVGGPENPLLNGSDLSTMIGPGRGDASFDGFGVSKYQNRRTVSNNHSTMYHWCGAGHVQCLSGKYTIDSSCLIYIKYL